MKDFDKELDDILNEIEEDDKVLEVNKENQDLLNEFKTQNQLLKSLLQESDDINSKIAGIFDKQNEIIDFSNKCTKNVYDAMNRMLSTKLSLVVDDKTEKGIADLFGKMEKEMYRMHKQFIEKYQQMIELQKESKTKKINSPSNILWLMLIVCTFILQLISLICVILKP